MKRRILTTLGAAAVLLAGAMDAPAQGLLHVPLDNAGDVRTKGPWQARIDHRQLLAMRHPWEASETGNFASYTRTVTVPEDWQGPFELSFYCSDDYHAADQDVPGSLSASGFVGHRKKEVWVDGESVWTADVSDAVTKGESPYFTVPVEASPGDELAIKLLVFDTVTSRRRLAQDFFRQPDNEDGDAAQENRFQTHVYWGDVYLLAQDAEPPRGSRPSTGNVQEVHNRRWPLEPFGEPWPNDSVQFDVSAPGGISDSGFPLTMGISFHAEAVSGDSQVRFSTPQGALSQRQTKPTGWWPGDSLKWLLLDTVVTPDTNTITMELGREAQASAAGADASAEGGRVEASWGPYTARAGLESLLAGVSRGEDVLLERLRLRIETPKGAFWAVPGAASVQDAGPARTTVVVDGRFDAADAPLATFKLYLSVFGELPYVRGRFRLFNSTEADLSVDHLALELTMPGEVDSCTVPGGALEPGGTVRQTAVGRRVLTNGDAEQSLSPTAPFYAQAGGVTLCLRYFRELFPKAFRFTGDTMEAGLVAAPDQPITFTPGEAKTHEFWLAFGEIDGEALANAVRRPPILQNAAYYTSTGALGPAALHEGIPVLHEHMTNDFGDKTWDDLGQRYGVRHFPDSPYHGGLPKWSNNYYERMLNLWSEWYMSGDRAWYTLAADVSRHLMDVAIVHSPVPGHDWEGAIHGPGENHVAGPWNPNLRIEGLAQHGHLTGDPGALDAAIDVAEYCVRKGAGIDGGSVRQQAGPFDAICTAFAETGDVRFLDDGQERVDSVYRAMDMRRGVWPDIHGSYVYRGNVPWMAAQIGRPLYWWYRLTGDVNAAQALVGLAESIVCENTQWDEPGAVYGYSHNPRFDMTASYDLLILPIIFAAYELTEDEFFLDAAKAQWQRWKSAKQFDSPLNCHWNTPWLVHYLKRYNVEDDEEANTTNP